LPVIVVTEDPKVDLKMQSVVVGKVALPEFIPLYLVEVLCEP
jgi:hypothetical protein